ncbi:Tetratricopeptide repeat-containing protein [Desulfuromusa kysingii]|uniref:Tetratricopeptide repeat-containing protein n=1 Tax=Desulfuromusa kysingii TaxID=37625 RepID=A0A1H4ARR2_9BACT|nr:tetratricopeptide repeat protein [Desulfuromusa kysingii]SEA38559.1 Tetratricopeptide repeat-containing protein [Desulfuromusa kysingii]
MPIFVLFILLSVTPNACATNGFLSFADSLAAEKDYYRAITEYKRFLHYTPEDSRAAYAQLAIGQCLLAGERWQQADSALEKVWTVYPESDEAKTARQLYADAAYNRGDFAAAEVRYRAIQDTAPADANRYKLGLSQLQQDKPDQAHSTFSQFQAPLKQQLSLSLDAYQQLENKSPQLAGTLSALLPGAGQLYTERPLQAGIAFALNTAFIYGAIESWENENYATAGILSLFEIGWYGGNIYNAMNNAHKFNRRQQDHFLNQLQHRFGFSLGWQQGRPQLQAQFNF